MALEASQFRDSLAGRHIPEFHHVGRPAAMTGQQLAVARDRHGSRIRVRVVILEEQLPGGEVPGHDGSPGGPGERSAVQIEGDPLAEDVRYTGLDAPRVEVQ